MTPTFLEPETVEQPRCKRCTGLIDDWSLEAGGICEPCLLREAQLIEPTDPTKFRGDTNWQATSAWQNKNNSLQGPPPTTIRDNYLDLDADPYWDEGNYHL